jgi:UDP-N-acetyl-D-glucosamine dehydrogenase
MEFEGKSMESVDLLAGAAEADCVVIITDHRDFPYAEVLQTAGLIVDTRNALKGMQSEKIVKL